MPRLKNSKWERFCREYVKDLNATQAYIRAGYAKKGAETSASRLLTNVKVKSRIAELQDRVEEVIEDDAKRIREDLRAMSRVSVEDIFNDNHTIKEFSEMTRGARLLVQGFKYKMGELTEVKIYDKLKTIDMLGRHFAVSAWEENVNLHDVDSRVERMRRYQARIGKRGKMNPLNETDKKEK